MRNEKGIVKLNAYTINKYYDVFINIKRDSDNGDRLTAAGIRHKYRVSSEFCSTLRKLKVLIRKDNRLVWNASIKPSVKLAQTVAVQASKKIKSYSKRIAINESKKIKLTPIKIEPQKKVNDVGLIRRFLRWIY